MSRTSETDDLTGVVLDGEGNGPGDGDRTVAPLGGRPIVSRVVSTVTAVTERPPVVVVRTAGERQAVSATLPDDVHIRTDASDFEGPLGGLVAGARATETEWVFVCGADMPFLVEDAVSWVVDCRSPADAAVVPTANGDDPCPTHAVYRREAVLDTVAELEPDADLVDLLDALPAVRLVDAATAPAAVPLRVSMTDVDSSEKLEMARQLLP